MSSFRSMVTTSPVSSSVKSSFQYLYRLFIKYLDSLSFNNERSLEVIVFSLNRLMVSFFIAYFTLKLAYLYIHFDIQCFTTCFCPCLTRGKNCLFLIIRFRQIKIEIIHTHLPYLLLKFLFPFVGA